MRSRRAEILRLRQQLLLARCELQRHQVAGQLQAWQAPLRAADRLHAGWLWLHQHPEWLLAGAALVVVLRPRRTLRMLPRLVGLWRLALRVRALLLRPA